MTEHHILVSSPSSNCQFVGHVYVARRNPVAADMDQDIQGALSKLAEVIEQFDDRWMPMMLTTNLSDASSKKLRELFVRSCPEFTDNGHWQNYTDKKDDFFVAVVLLPDNDLNNKEIMDLH